MGGELAHVVVGLNDDVGLPYVYETEWPGDAEDDTDAFDADVPADLVARWKAARAEFDRLSHDICVAAGFDDQEGRMATCCPSWVGHETPGAEWWEIVLAASGTDDEWPVRDAKLGHHTDEASARALLDGLPDEFFVAYGVPRLQRVRKADLSIAHSSFRPSVGRCTRCGWDRDDHDQEVGR